jgi:putative tryptophan/tyrosine transport system substrate-binding protein
MGHGDDELSAVKRRLSEALAVIEQREEPAVEYEAPVPDSDKQRRMKSFTVDLPAGLYRRLRNLAIVYRSAEGKPEQLAGLAAELVGIPVAVIAALGGDVSVLSAKAATATIPIVFETGGDPVESGIVASFNRPGGNVTGASFLGSLVAAKQLGLMRDIVPDLGTLGLLLNPTNPSTA